MLLSNQVCLIIEKITCLEWRDRIVKHMGKARQWHNVGDIVQLAGTRASFFNSIPSFTCPKHLGSSQSQPILPRVSCLFNLGVPRVDYRKEPRSVPYARPVFLCLPAKLLLQYFHSISPPSLLLLFASATTPFFFFFFFFYLLSPKKKICYKVDAMWIL